MNLGVKEVVNKQLVSALETEENLKEVTTVKTGSQLKSIPVETMDHKDQAEIKQYFHNNLKDCMIR